jgi:hypothetical protein
VTATLCSNNVQLHCMQPPSSKRQLIAMIPFLSDPVHSPAFITSLGSHEFPRITWSVLYVSLAPPLHCNLALHPANPLAPAPDPSLIPEAPGTQEALSKRSTILLALIQGFAKLFHACDCPSHHAALLSLQCQPVEVYLDTVSCNQRLCHSDGDFINGCHFRFGTAGTNPHVVRW